MIKIKNNLIQKSIESFLLGLELYNKPTLKYRIEGFSFFICNAWELMLKAELINRGISIYYTDKPDRTLSINECIKKIYSDKNTRIRLNLEKIIELRNISTHYITEDYEVHYVPLLQACVINYSKELLRFHKEVITDYVPNNFLTISMTYEPLSKEEIKLKYPAEIAEMLIRKSNEIDILAEEYNSDKFSINIKQNLYITKKRDQADFTVTIDNKSKNKVSIIKDYKDPYDTHPLNFNTIVNIVNDKMNKKNLQIDNKNGFTRNILTLFINYYDIKNEKKYAYCHRVGKTETYSYSRELVDFIIECIKRNPNNFCANLKGAKKR